MKMNNVQLLKLAESYLGDGGGRFQRYCGLPSSAPWCCAFVRTVFDEGGDSKLFFGGKNVVSCPTALTWCRANLADIPIYLALPSDIVLFDWKPGTNADHIGFALERESDQVLRTIEGNTSGGIVDTKSRTAKYIIGCFRPDFPATFNVEKKLDIDGAFGYNSIAAMQRALGGIKVDGILGKKTVKALQKRVGVVQDGSWGKKTSKAVQKQLCGFKGSDVDGWFGEKSVKALQRWCNDQNGFNDKPKKRVVKIGQATCDERGKAQGGKAGDQTGKEVGISNWSYSTNTSAYNHWTQVFRAKDPRVATKIAESMVEACNNPHIGYDLSSSDRGTLYDAAKKVGWNIAKIKTNCETSCVDLVSVCLNSAGIGMPKYWASKNVYKDLMATDKFECFTAKEYTASSGKLHVGDILCSPNAPHTAMVVSVESR